MMRKRTQIIIVASGMVGFYALVGCESSPKATQPAPDELTSHHIEPSSTGQAEALASCPEGYVFDIQALPHNCSWRLSKFEFDAYPENVSYDPGENIVVCLYPWFWGYWRSSSSETCQEPAREPSPFWGYCDSSTPTTWVSAGNILVADCNSRQCSYDQPSTVPNFYKSCENVYLLGDPNGAELIRKFLLSRLPDPA
jgi:hypothetical protein